MAGVPTVGSKGVKDAVKREINVRSVLDVDECGNSNSANVKVRYTGAETNGNKLDVQQI